MRRLIVIMVLIGLLGSLAAVTQAQGDDTPKIEWDKCPFAVPRGEVDGETIRCGTLSVPQDRRQPDAQPIRLAFAILQHTADPAAPDPMLYLEGGPGDSALASIEVWLNSPFRQTRDIVLLDQRGTGYSDPRLVCDELDQLEDDSAEDRARQDCAARLKQEGVDLSDYNSIASAADVADLRVALGYESWNLYGVSYGTRLALTVMRDYPAGVRSVILDSTYPPVVDAYEEEAANTNRVFRLMFDDCAADAACNAAYPDLENRFYGLVESLDNEPVFVPELDTEYDGAAFVDLLFDQFYDTATIPFLPLVIDQVENGDTSALIDLSEGYLPEDYSDYSDYSDYYGDYGGDYTGDYTDDYSDYNGDYGSDSAEDVSSTDGMFDAFECNEEIPFNSVDDAEALSVSFPAPLREAGLAVLLDQIEICATWDSGTAGASEDQAVTSDLPTLILAGAYDPVTPPQWGLIAASPLPRSFFFEFPGVGHAVIDGGNCPLNMALAFLDTPTSAPDGNCIAGMTGPVFVLP